MQEKILKLIGKNSGSTSIILVGIHGDETCGAHALQKILPRLQISRGVVLFGWGNPRAIAANRRCTETNLNRMFKPAPQLTPAEKKSYEFRRAQFLKKYLNQADALLDIHASSIPHSKPFIISEANAKKIVRFLPVNLVVSGFDKIEPGGTDYYMNGLGKIGICLECGYLNNRQSVAIATKGIFAFLKARGHLTNDLTPKKQKQMRFFQKYFTRTDRFTLAKPFKNFAAVKKNQLIGIDGQKEIRAAQNSFLLFAHNCTAIGSEAFLLGKKIRP